jgi:predicted nucleotidyltransferase
MQEATYIEKLVSELARVRELAQQYATEVRKHFGARLKRVRLFGSAARGDWTQESDIDVLVLLDRVNPEDFDYLIDTAMRMGVLDSGMLIQPIPMTANEFDEMKQRERRLALDIEREGIEL